jgi:ACS family hexuronate transporter-like MFS transporter
MSTSSTANSVGLSSKTRWAIVALLSASMAINLLDRQIINVLAPILRESYKWSATQYAYIAVAFQIGMMIGQVPAGSFMDRVGTRLGLATIFAAWSIVGGAQAFVASLAGFIVLRFLMGLTECGNYTAGIKAIAGLFPGASRSTAGGVFNAGAQLGSVIAPLFVLALLRERLGFSVSLAFLFTTALGLIWLIPWLAIFPDKETMAAVSVKPAGAPATASATSVTLGQLIRNRQVLGLFLIRVFSGPITTFYWTWLPQYLRTGRGMSFLAIGIFASLPNLFGMTGNVVGGLLTDRLVKITGSIDRGRKLGFAGAFGLGALSMVMPFVANDYVALGLMGLALFGNQWVAATYIGAVGDIVPQQLAGRVNGIAGFGDSTSTLVAMLLTGVIVDRYSYTPVFLGAGILPLLAMASVFFIMRRIEAATFGGNR